MSLKAALKRAQEDGVLHVAHPRGCNTQQQPDAVQQATATGMQQPALKASNSAVSDRNRRRNSNATTTGKTCNKPGDKPAPFVARADGRQVVWRVVRGGREICTLITPGGATYERALAAARLHWPDADVVPFQELRP